MPDEIEETVTVIPSESALEIKTHAEITKVLVEDSKAPSEDKDIVVVASNPRQMQVAQTELISWAETRTNNLATRKAEAQENLDIAIKNKWSTKALKKIVADLEKDRSYYEKIETALRNGYVLVPNFDEIDIFAIRTTKMRPKRQSISMQKWSRNTRPVLNAEETNSPTVGEGRYVNADPAPQYHNFEKPGREGSSSTSMVRATAEGFKSVDFPFHLAKPQILEKTSEAMKLLCFDDIGILPGRRRSRRRGDPMVIGRIVQKQSRFKFHVTSFLITWFVDTKDL